MYCAGAGVDELDLVVLVLPPDVGLAEEAAGRGGKRPELDLVVLDVL